MATDKPKRKMSENSLKNLETEKYKFSKDNPEIAQNNQKKSVAKRKQNQTLAELIKIALKLQDEETGETNDLTITNALIKQAKNGNVKAYEVIRDTIGEKPTEKHEIKDVTPEIKVATQEDLNALEKLKNANFDKGIS